MLFSVDSGKLRATDPCYDPETWCAGTIENVRNGLWHVRAKYHEEGKWHRRVAELIVVHESYKDQEIENDAWQKMKFEGGVDSGQFGFFDFGPWLAMQQDRGIGEYGDENSFYGKICTLTHDPEVSCYGSYVGAKQMAEMYPDNASYKEQLERYTKQWEEEQERRYNHPQMGVIRYGVASSSGWGDGGYSVYAHYDTNGEVVGARVVFISDEPEDDFYINEEESEDANV